MAAAVAATTATRAHACAPAPRAGAVVAIADEDAIVAYDPTMGRQDFVRRASFRTRERDFGFLVPTPTRPALAAAPDEVFDRLARHVEPRVVVHVTHGGFELGSFCLLTRGSRPPTAGAASVRVLETTRVAGYDAAVLAADDAQALAAWLREHGYADRPALSAWLEPYVEKRWIVTAFRIAGGASEAAGLSTEAVRMTFTTDRPFFPYREPADQRENLPASAPEGPPRESSRRLRVFVVQPGRADAALGAGAAWASKLLYAGAIAPSTLGDLPFPLPPNPWLTAFEDASSPRPGLDDLFFTASRDPAPFAPPPVAVFDRRKIMIPIEIVALLVLAIGAALVVRRRRRAG